MICKKHALIICLTIIGLFVSNLLSSEKILSDQNCLSKIVSEQIYRIAQKIEETSKETSSQEINLKIKHLEDQKQTVINTWRSGNLSLVLKILPEDLKLRAISAKADFATPVLDTRDWDHK